MLHGLMMDQPLLISSLISHAARFHADTEIVSRTVEGGIHRYGYADAEVRAKKLAQALGRLGGADVVLCDVRMRASASARSPGTATATTSSITVFRACRR